MRVFLFLSALFLFNLSCNTAPKEERVCLVFQLLPINPMTGEVDPNIPPMTQITCDSIETQRLIFQPKGQ